MIRFPNNLDQREQEQLAIAFFNVSTRIEVKAFYQFLHSELARLDKDNRHETDSDAFRVRQGACQALEALLKEIDGGSDTFDRLKSK